MGLISITTDRLSGAEIHLSLAHIESIRFDKLGANSHSAYKITMTSGKSFNCYKEDGRRVLAVLKERDQ